MEGPRKGYGLAMRVRALILLAMALLLASCFSESGLRDEVREATDAIDSLIDDLQDEPTIRDAADRAKDAAAEARAALEDFRENPNAETRRALEDAEGRLNEARETIDRLVERAPEQVRGALGEIVDALERIRREMRQDLEE